ncbi:hypothetical protein FEM48_Zijuj09G0015800 [Ziziphus jujuba var. spinosa]|uniref:Protein FAR1-RELATED SEQUENCE n=1 Tax=Ziziphus jujuba var. spinosa TaxID=714518 RepID=A0A978UQ52_ZIZJJ|nr:hypothetical protein FEM48_Zijuj09G0015800 [Ziziphus jujuba var. spinosa]
MSELRSLVKETSENGMGSSPDDIGTVEEVPEETILCRQTSVNLVPFVGQRFVSQDAAYEFYCSFAKQCGFSIRRHRTRGKDGVGRGITRRDFTCHRGGYPQLKPTDDGKLQRNRKSSRCGCQAYMRIVKRADFDVPEWRITGFSNIHNHELLKSNEVQLLPAFCTMTADDKSRICMYAKAGMSVRQMLRLMELEKGVKLGCLPFTEIDVRNLLQSFRNVDRDNDAIDLLKMCKDKKDKDPNFKYNFQIDTNNRLEIETFLEFVNGKAPETILTDQNMWLKEAIAIEMPRTKHAFCIWHIIARFSDWFSVVLGSQYDTWKAEFHRLYNLDSVEDFEVGWKEMVDAYRLQGNKHIVSLYALRMYWALPYLRCYFFAGMTCTFQSDSINAYIQRVLGAQSLLHNFVEQVAAIVDIKDEGGAQQKMQRKVQKVSLKTGSPIESHAVAVLTPYAFCKLQEELVLAPQYASLMVDDTYFIVRHHTEMDGGCKVLWSPHDEFISCSCHQFEFSGIICRHVLRVLSTNNCFHIPDRYLPIRWRNVPFTKPFQGEQSGKVQLLQSMVSTIITESVETEERLDVACDQIAVILSRIKEFPGPEDCANHIGYNRQSDSLILPEVEDSDDIVQGYATGNSHESITLGKLKERRYRDGIDIFRKRRRCSVPCCGQFGHDATDCPMIEDGGLNGDGLGFL